MGFIITGPTEHFIAALFPQQQDHHCQDRRWHLKMVIANPGYLADIAARQADKRARGIGPEGLCHA